MIATSRRHRLLLIGRWAVAYAMLAWASAMLVTNGVPPICSDQAAGNQTVELCRPMSALDLPAVAFSTTVLLLVTPELRRAASRFGVRRELLTMRREVAALRADLDRTREVPPG